MSLQLVLSDGSTIDIVEAGYTQHFVVSCEDMAEFQQIWDRMTDENLSDVKITENGKVISRIVGMTLTGTQTIINPNKTLTGHFYMAGGEYVADEYSEAGRILLGEEE